MKKLFILLTGMLFLMGLNSCKKKHHAYPKVPPPHWEVKGASGYSSSMTVVVTVPKKLISAANDGADQISAFIAGECRGVGTPVDGSVNGKEFFIMVHGNAAENEDIIFRYYCAKQSRMYEAGTFFSFSADGTYGSVDAPAILNLHPVQ